MAGAASRLATMPLAWPLSEAGPFLEFAPARPR